MADLNTQSPWPFGDLERGKYRAILADPPWPFATWSHIGLAGDTGQKNRRQRSRAAPYETMAHDDIYSLPVSDLAADDCVLFLWVVQTQLPQALALLEKWGFEFKTCAFAWFKGEGSPLFPEDIHVPIGCGYWTRAQFEQCWLATRGKPKRSSADVRQAILERRREHSRKPDCVHERIERLVKGPYCELFARHSERPGWDYWGNQIEMFNEPIGGTNESARHMDTRARRAIEGTLSGREIASNDSEYIGGYTQHDLWEGS